MKKIQDKQIEGIIFKGAFCPYWGGVNTNKSQSFFSGGLYDISITLLADNHNAGVVEVYEEDKQIRSEPFKGQEWQDSKTRI